METANADLVPLKIGDRIVWISDSGPEFGEVKWLGLSDVCSELVVGVEFDNPVGTGTGQYMDHRLFNTRMNHASLIPISGIIKADVFLEDRSYGNSMTLPSIRTHPLPMEASMADEAPLKIGDCVVWVSDSGPEFGEVKWLGKIDECTQLMVGVEFNNPVGTGTGKYKNNQLFETKLNHASLVPIVGLMKADAFLEEKSFIRETRSVTRSSSFPTLKQPSCAVCLESLTGETYALECTHAFHWVCLVQCIRRRIIKCPLCQRVMSLTIIKHLYPDY